ncbi:MAG: hypothetical protein HGA80_06025, partial [Candidatus Omnitrophica bacterium]|nr:hypothetical protein [Candidatus Omnitrophota bacterium]
MNSLLYFQICLILGSISALASGVFVFIRNRGSLVNKTWLGTALTSAIWSLGYCAMISSATEQMAWWGCWVLHAASVFIPALHLHFVLALLNRHRRGVLIFAYLFSLVLFLVNPSKLFIQSVVPRFGFHYCCTAGPIYIAFAVYFCGAVLYSWYLLVMAIIKQKGVRALQLKYFFVSSLVGFIGGGQVFFLTFNISIPPILICLFAMYPLVVWYAIVRYRLMDIRVAVTSAGLFMAVYLVALGVPFYFYNTGHPFPALLLAVVLATIAPVIYAGLRKRAEDSLLKEERAY